MMLHHDAVPSTETLYPTLEMQCKIAQYQTQHSPSSSCQFAARGKNQLTVCGGGGESCMGGRQHVLSHRDGPMLCDNNWSITPVGTIFRSICYELSVCQTVVMQPKPGRNIKQHQP